MRIGIVGLPQSGKTTIFNVLTGAGIETGGFHSAGQDTTHIHVVPVVDRRLDELHKLYPTAKKVYSTIEYVDVAGVVKAEGRDTDQEKAVYSHLIGIDMLLLVLRSFGDEAIPHPEGAIDPVRDFDIFQTELMFRDLGIVEKRLERLTKAKKKPDSGHERLEIDILEKCMDCLSRGIPVRTLELSPEERKILRSYQLMSEKPLLVVLNIGENDIGKKEERAGELQSQEIFKHVTVIPVCGRLEMDLAQMEDDEAAEFMKEYGIDEPAAGILTRTTRDMLNLISFFTVGDKEVRAWPIPNGAKAREAAGSIHTDLEKGFIRAEVVFWEDLAKRGSFAKCKEDGVFRLEGKDYIVRDGEITHIRFNV